MFESYNCKYIDGLFRTMACFRDPKDENGYTKINSQYADMRSILKAQYLLPCH